jgi:acyl-CoA synthetase (AMP-forming)/AMP-acid ligase II
MLPAEMATNWRPLSPWMRLRARVADRLVFREIRESLGGRLRFAVSGGAGLPPSLGRFFYGLGLPILEGYGLTETAPVLAINTPMFNRFGTVGRLLPGTEARLEKVEGVRVARGENGGYELQVTELHRAVPALFDELARRGIPLARFPAPDELLAEPLPLLLGDLALGLRSLIV